MKPGWEYSTTGSYKKDLHQDDEFTVTESVALYLL
jgi:hypothetical protein